MKKRIVTKKRAFLSSLALILAVVMVLSPPFSAYVQAEVQWTKGDPYFADVDTNFINFNEIKYCNESGSFGKKRGTDYYFHPFDKATKEEALTYVYNTYRKKVDFGNHKYRKVGNKAWRWAQSNGLVGAKTNPKALARYQWLGGVIEKLSTVISHGSSGILFGSSADTSQSPHIERWMIATFIYRLGGVNPEYDPKNLPDIK